MQRRLAIERFAVTRFHPEIPTATTMIEKGGYRGRSTKFNAKYFVINNAAPDRWEPEVAVSCFCTGRRHRQHFY